MSIEIHKWVHYTLYNSMYSKSIVQVCEKAHKICSRFWFFFHISNSQYMCSRSNKQQELIFLAASIAEALYRKFGRSMSHVLWDIQAWKWSNMRKICLIIHITVKWWRSWEPKTKFHPMFLGFLTNNEKINAGINCPWPPKVHSKNWKNKFFPYLHNHKTALNSVTGAISLVWHLHLLHCW